MGAEIVKNLGVFESKFHYRNSSKVGGNNMTTFGHIGETIAEVFYLIGLYFPSIGIV